MLNSFVSWASQICSLPAYLAFQPSLKINKISDNSSATLDFEGENFIGRLTFWNDGSYFIEIIDLNTAETIFAKKGYAMSTAEINKVFQDAI